MFVCLVIWCNWLNFDGFFNVLFVVFGIEGVCWLFDLYFVLWLFVFVDVWQWMLMVFLIVLVGLQLILQELYEVVCIDGVSEWQCLCDIMLLFVVLQIGFVLLLCLIDMFKLFDKVYVLMGGGFGNVMQMLLIYIYDMGFCFFNVGLVSVVLVLMFVVFVLLVLGYVWQMVCKWCV